MTKKLLLAGLASLLSINCALAITVDDKMTKELKDLKLDKNKSFMKNFKTTIAQIPSEYMLSDFMSIKNTSNIIALITHKKMTNKKMPILITADGTIIMGISPLFVADEKLTKDISAKIEKMLPEVDTQINSQSELESKFQPKSAKEIALEALKSVPDNFVLEFKNKKSDKYAVIISDPECPYCRAHLKDKMPEMIKEMSVKVYFAPVHLESASKKAQAILNAAKKTKTNDKKLALMNKYYAENYILTDKEQKIDISEFEKHKAHILLNSGITGVPAVFIFDKEK